MTLALRRLAKGCVTSLLCGGRSRTFAASFSGTFSTRLMSSVKVVDLSDSDSEELVTRSKWHCPVCSVGGVPEPNRQQHVNRCLDRQSPSKSKSARTPLSHFSKPGIHSMSGSKHSSIHSMFGSKRAFSSMASSDSSLLSSSSTAPVSYYSASLFGRADAIGKGKHKSLTNGNDLNMDAKQEYERVKVIRNTNVVVDGFRNSSLFAPKDSVFCLSHFHSDHYTGLTPRFSGGPIYCSKLTAKLCSEILNVSDEWLRPRPLNTEYTVFESDTQRVHMTLLEANHCPGAVMFYFRVEEKPETVHAKSDFGSAQKRISEFSGKLTAFDTSANSSAHLCGSTLSDGSIAPRSDGSDSEWKTSHYLHVGDFRYEIDPKSLFQTKNADFLNRFKSGSDERLDCVYLDTTFYSSEINLPKQCEAIDTAANACYTAMKAFDFNAGTNKKLCILVGVYSIGKQRILDAIYDKLQAHLKQPLCIHGYTRCRIYKCLEQVDYWQSHNSANASSSKAPSSKASSSKASSSMLRWTSQRKDCGECDIHVVALNDTCNELRIADTWLAKGCGYTHVLAVKPTGWNGSHLSATSGLLKTSHCGRVLTLRVPYSEHSSFDELCCFLADFNPKEAVPTVEYSPEAENELRQRQAALCKSAKESDATDVSDTYLQKYPKLESVAAGIREWAKVTQKTLDDYFHLCK